jgi:hypothetical protein
MQRDSDQPFLSGHKLILVIIPGGVISLRLLNQSVNYTHTTYHISTRLPTAWSSNFPISYLSKSSIAIFAATTKPLPDCKEPVKSSESRALGC